VEHVSKEGLALALAQEMDDLSNWDPNSGAAVAMDGQKVRNGAAHTGSNIFWLYMRVFIVLE
jgi:hypothetical protein